MILVGQEDWLDVLAKMDKRLHIAYNISGGRPGKWRGYFTGVAMPVDYRTVHPYEVIFDLDSDKWKRNQKLGEDLIKTLNDNRTPNMVAWSGGKGVHVHVFFTMSDAWKDKIFNTDNPVELIELRKWIFRYFSDKMTVSHTAGRGEELDNCNVNWDDKKMGHLVRAFGGQKVDKDGNVKGYKTLMDDIPSLKPRSPTGDDASQKMYDDVVYPDQTMPVWTIPDATMDSFYAYWKNNQDQKAKKDNIRNADAMLNYGNTNTYFSLPCVQQLSNNGVPEGKRSMSAQILSIMLNLDKAPQQDAYDFMDNWYNNKLPKSDLDPKELKNWVDWSYLQSKVFWNCALCVQIGVCDQTSCSYNQLKYADVYGFLKEPTLLDIIEHDLERMGHRGDREAKLLMYIFATSRLLKRPIDGLIKGDSSVGKSFMVNTVLKLMPPSEDKDDPFGGAVVKFTRATANALYHMKRDALKHKVVVIQELDGATDAEYSIRTMQSEEELRLAIPVKKPDGTIQTVVKIVDGPMQLTITTAQASIDVQNETRSFEVWVDDSDGQTANIQDVQRDNFDHTKYNKSEQEEIMYKHSIAQKSLKVTNITMSSFVHKIRFPKRPIRVRRDHDRFLCLIACIAFLHQYQRDIIEAHGKNWVVATTKDFYMALDLIKGQFSRTLASIPPTSANMYGVIAKMVEDRRNAAVLANVAVPTGIDNFTRSEVRDAFETINNTSIAESSVRKYIKPLVDGGYITIFQGGQKGQTYIYTYTGRVMDNTLDISLN